jgi:hypothetical protein
VTEPTYGRLFTYDDVRRITRQLILDPRFGGVGTTDHAIAAVEHRLTFPADEPLLLLRGEDAKHGPRAPVDYAESQNDT